MSSPPEPPEDINRQIVTLPPHTPSPLDSAPADPAEQILTNLRNAKAVWGENSSQYLAAKSIAEEFLVRKEGREADVRPKDDDDGELVARLEGLVLGREGRQ